MKLPNFFIADLPPEAALTPRMVAEACQTLKRNREHYLANQSTTHLVKVLSKIAENWLNPEDAFRRLALEQGPAHAGFPAATLARGLDAFFQELTREKLHALIEQELGHSQRLDAMSSTITESRQLQEALATGPGLLVHFTAGNVPSPALQGMVLGLLARSAQFLKCSRGTSLLPRLFAHSIHQAEPKIASCLEIAEWAGGEPTLEDPLFAEADCVIATGSDETLASIRRRLPIRVRFLGHGHQLSFGFVSNEMPSMAGARKLIARAADDVVAWNQQGCLSPHVYFVQSGGAMGAEQFAELLAAELARREELEPRGPIPLAESAVIQARREIYSVRAVAGTETRLWSSEGSTAWTVVCEADEGFPVSCLNRFIHVKPVPGLEMALQCAEAVREHVSTVGLAAYDDAAGPIAERLARWGATRICPIGRMQLPPLTWRHDGRPALGDLITWTGWER